MTKAELRQTVINFLNNHKKAVFAILDNDGLPTTSLMLYVIDDEMNVYFGTRKTFSKYGNLQKNTIVSLSVIEEVLDPLKVVDLRGTAVEISSEQTSEIHTFFKSKNQSKYYVEGAEDFVMFKLTPDFVRWLDATSGQLSIIDIHEMAD
ncbi:MAG: pyridoxamine 5'-phosphate oxidase family protein [Patescibacteria group bacterium]